jgi:hypothetical protein
VFGADGTVYESDRPVFDERRPAGSVGVQHIGGSRASE